jgi:hypothetical protein
MKTLICMNCHKPHQYKDSEIPPLVKKGEASIVCDDCNSPDYTNACEVCGATPVHKVTGMCGPCSFGEVDTLGGNW